MLGGGAFSEVYQVEGPGGICALKLLRGALESLKRSTLEEFKNEFSVLKDMRHPYIASILDFGFDDTLERYYYTSEFIDGQDLLSASESLSLSVITDLFVQALRALSYLHSFRIYHFDIKAANVLVVSADKPSIKIIDFGLAGIDPRGRLIGTPSYMAPEIAARENADGRADLYSLGVLWYSAVARTNPFRAVERTETLSRQLKLVPEPPSHFMPAIPGWLDAVIMRLLEKNPANRFQVASAVIREINRLSGAHYPLETRETLLSYLPDEGRFVCREDEFSQIEGDLDRYKDALGKSGGCLIQGSVGTGKTRLLKELKYRLQLKDIHVSWASASERDQFASWCDRLASHISGGQEFHVFILDDAHLAVQDETARVRLLSLILKSKRPAKSSSAWIALATGPFEDESSRVSLESLLPLHIEVKAFSCDELGEYLVSLTGLEIPPAPFLEGLYERTEGNPFFVTEILKSLIAGGGLFDEKGRWKAAVFEDMGVDFSKAVIPHTMEELLLKRIASLSQEARLLIEALSAVSRPATTIELGAWAGIKDPYPAARELLQQGVLDRMEGFALRLNNALLGQVIYNAITLPRRSALHDRIAASLKESGATAEEILDHVRKGSNPKAAFAAALDLGEKALKAGRGEQAASYIKHALGLIDPNDIEQRVDVQMKLGEAFLISHDYAAASEQFSAVKDIIASYSESPTTASWQAGVLTRLGGTLIKLSQFDRARAVFHDAKTALKLAGGDKVRELTIENFLGSIVYFEGHLEEAKRIFEKTRNAASQIAEGQKERITNNDLGIVMTALNKLDDAETILNDDLKQALEIGDDLIIGRAHYNLAQMHSSRKAYDEAIESYKQCAEVCRRSHNTELLLRVYNGLGNAYQIMNEPDQGIAFYERGLALHERIGDLRGGAAIGVNMGILESARGKIEAALDHLIPAVEYLRSVPSKASSDWVALSRGLLELGDISRKKGRQDEARGYLEEARHIASRISQAAPQRFWITAALLDVARAQGREGELSDLMTMLESLAAGEAERRTLEEIKKQRRVSEKMEAPPSQGLKEAGRAPSISAQAPDETEKYLALLEINKLIAADTDVQYVIKTALFYALELANAPAGAIIIIDNKGFISLKHERNMEDREEDPPFFQKIFKHVLESSRPVYVDDACTDGRFAKEHYVRENKLRSILCLPLRVHKRTTGILYLENRHQVSAFAKVNMRLLEAFAEQVGPPIETAILLTKASRKEKELSTALNEAILKAEHAETQLMQQQKQFKSGQGESTLESPVAFLDDVNAYDPEKSWADYERLIIAKCYEANDFRAKPTASELGIATTTLYKRIKDFDLENRANKSYREPFTYERGKKIEDYLPPIFSAALKAAHGKPKDAIANLRVSQGYFYKVIKAAKKMRLPSDKS